MPISLHSTTVEAWNLPLADFLPDVVWRDRAGADAREAARHGEARFLKWLRKPSALPRWPAPRSVPDPLWQALWSRNVRVASGRTASDEAAADRQAALAGVVEDFARDRAAKKREGNLLSVLKQFTDAAPPTTAEVTLLLSLLSAQRRELADNALGRLWQACLLGTAGLTAGLEAGVPVPLPIDEAFALEAETPLIAGTLLEAVQGSTNLRRSGRSAFAKNLDELTDTDGTPHASTFDRLTLLIASMTRAACVDSANGQQITQKARLRFADLVDWVATAADQAGRTALSNGSADTFAPASVIRAAVRVAELEASRAGRRRASQLRDDIPLAGRTKHKPGPHPAAVKDAESSQSEWAAVASLRGDASDPPASCVVAFDTSVPRVELVVNGKPLVSGPWNSSLRLDGQELGPPADWRSVCWYSDEEADYLELEADADGAKLLRSILLLRDDGLLFLNSSVANAGDRKVELASSLSLAGDLTPDLDVRDRYLWLRRKRAVARVVPLGLDPDKMRPAGGALRVTDDGVEVEQSSPASGLCVPIAIDFAKHRRSAPLDWGRATVAESGAAVSRGHADAWRLRSGRAQWLFMQGLSRGANARTFLGVHTFDESSFGRFQDGEFEALVTVAAEG